MERKKLKFMDIKEENILDREEMRNVMAGSGGGTGTGCIECVTPTGEECWYRSSYSDPTAVCNNIYPKYNGSGVTGIAIPCTERCYGYSNGSS